MICSLYWNYLLFFVCLCSKKPPAAREEEEIPSYVTQYDEADAGKKPVKPEFVVPLNDCLKKKEGASAHFACRIQPASDPTMRIEWFKNDIPLFIGEYVLSAKPACVFDKSYHQDHHLPLFPFLTLSMRIEWFKNDIPLFIGESGHYKPARSGQLKFTRGQVKISLTFPCGQVTLYTF